LELERTMKTSNLGLYAFRLTFGQVSTRTLNQAAKRQKQHAHSGGNL